MEREGEGKKGAHWMSTNLYILTSFNVPNKIIYRVDICIFSHLQTRKQIKERLNRIFKVTQPVNEYEVEIPTWVQLTRSPYPSS